MTMAKHDSPQFHVRRAKAALFQWVRIPPGNYRSSRKQPEQLWRQRSG